jgi:Arc/MetJ family transcription regulator
MRITIVLDDDLVGKAQEITGIADRVSLIHEALRVLVQHETGRVLVSLGGTMADLKNIPRR